MTSIVFAKQGLIGLRRCFEMCSMVNTTAGGRTAISPLGATPDVSLAILMSQALHNETLKIRVNPK
ncbi:MAG: hypothetical protein V4794_18140 [Pseudomonadota bacterium]